VQGEVNIDEVNEMLGIDLPEGEEFETLAGFVFNRAGRLVEEGEEIEFDEIRIRIERVDNTRIMSARVTVLDGADDGAVPSTRRYRGAGLQAEATPNDAE